MPVRSVSCLQKRIWGMVGAGDARRAKMSSFSCSFAGKIGQTVGWRLNLGLAPHLTNPGSATHHLREKHLIWKKTSDTSIANYQNVLTQSVLCWILQFDNFYLFCLRHSLSRVFFHLVITKENKSKKQNKKKTTTTKNKQTNKKTPQNVLIFACAFIGKHRF